MDNTSGTNGSPLTDLTTDVPVVDDPVDITKVDLYANEEVEEEAQEDRRKGCCLVGCLSLFLLLLLFFFALFLPVKKPGSTEPVSLEESTGAAKIKFISAESYDSYNGWSAGSKGLVTVVTIKITNIDNVGHLPNSGMIMLHERGYAIPYPVDNQAMVSGVYPGHERTPWNTKLGAGESRILKAPFSVPRPAGGEFDLYVRDFNWTSTEFQKIPMGRIKSNASTADPHIIPKGVPPKDQSF